MSHFLRRQKGEGGKWKTKTSCKQDQEITNYEKKKKQARIKMLMCIFFPSTKEQGSGNFIQIICMWKKILHYSALILIYFSPIWIVL